ncbi:hypothetical protein GCM10010191_46510 [Actinomadura vinacea]|uniref:Uncharacterized protein n=1 Tax=Actinomadura vinacea TaxID=115336 RepID=A0ABN3JEI5_9ACTN
MGAFASRIAATAVAGALATAGVAAVSAPTPAHADTAACVAYLTSQNQSTFVRHQICATADTLARTVSPQLADLLCNVLMATTGLPSATAQQACTLAIAAPAAAKKKN